MNKRAAPVPTLPVAADVRPGRRLRRRAEVTGRLYRSALALFQARGLHATTVQAITEAADVGKGTFFNYFPTKEHVLLQFYTQQRVKVEDAIRAVRGGRPVWQALPALMGRLSEEASHPALTRSFLQAIVSSDLVSELVLPELNMRRQLYEQLLDIGQQRGEVRTDCAAAELAAALLEVGFGTALFWSCHPATPLPTLLNADLRLLCSPQLPVAKRTARLPKPALFLNPHRIDRRRSTTNDADPQTQSDDPKQLGRRERRSLEIRDRLFRAATELFSARGIEATTAKAIADAADVGKGTFFNYFPTKEHILPMYYERRATLIDAARRAARNGTEPVLKTIDDLVERMAKPVTPALVRSFLQAIVSREAVRSLVLPILTANQRAFEEMCTLGQLRGEIRRDVPAAELARAVQEAGFGTSLFWSLRPTVALADRLVRNRALIWSPPSSNLARTRR